MYSYIAICVLLLLSLNNVESYTTGFNNANWHDGWFDTKSPATGNPNWIEAGANAVVRNYPAAPYNSYYVDLPFSLNIYNQDMGSRVSFDTDYCIRVYGPNGRYSGDCAGLHTARAKTGTKTWYEFVGTAPNRIAIFSWENTNTGNRPNANHAAQLRYYENGNIEFVIRSLVLSAGEYIFLGIDGPGATNGPAYGTMGGDWTGRSYGFYKVPPAPASVCGNSRVEGNEQCDGGACCNADCTFKTAAFSCRSPTGFCDLAEFCTGSSANCPADVFKSSSTPCDESFGVCNVRLARHCTGSSGVCSGVPVPNLITSTVDWLGYSVISFGDFRAESGSVGGRLAAKGNVIINGGFSVGNDVVFVPYDTNGPITPKPITYSFIGGHAVTWANGDLYPNSPKVEYGYAGDSFSGPESIGLKMTGNNAALGRNLDSDFANAQAYYTALSQNLDLETNNAHATFQWGGVFLTCDSFSGRYVVDLDASLLTDATWYSVDDTCAYGAAYVINIVGNGDVVFQGGDFPGIGERVLFNVVGSGRVIYVQTRVNGNILAPRSTLVQDGGVTAGLVIVGEVGSMSSSSVPSCESLMPFNIIVPAVGGVAVGATEANVAGFSAMRRGDSFKFDGSSSTHTITERSIDAEGHSVISFTPAATAVATDGAFLRATVADPSQERPNDTITTAEKNNAMTVAVSFVLSMIALLI